MIYPVSINASCIERPITKLSNTFIYSSSTTIQFIQINQLTFEGLFHLEGIEGAGLVSGSHSVFNGQTGSHDDQLGLTVEMVVLYHHEGERSHFILEVDRKQESQHEENSLEQHCWFLLGKGIDKK